MKPSPDPYDNLQRYHDTLERRELGILCAISPVALWLGCLAVKVLVDLFV